MSDPGTAPTLDELRRAWVRINYSGEIRRLGSAEDVYNRALALFDHPEYSIAALPASLPAPPAVTPDQIDQPDHCACSHNGRGELVTECQEHREIREQRDELLMNLESERVAHGHFAATMEHRALKAESKRDELLSALKQVEAEMRAGFGSSFGETREQVRRAIARVDGR